MYVKRNTEVHSRNQCCHWKALQINSYNETSQLMNDVTQDRKD